MSKEPFYRLAPFIQEFIYKKQWNVLREAQVEACRVILDTNRHMIIASGTASGKTEAALFPTLTELISYPARTVGILYVSPLKALINDQFQRLNDLLLEANIQVWAWHGDVAQSQKERLLRKPSGVLQITPESLEGLLMNRPSSVPSLFGDLRFIIIDEVHAFMGTDRGIQLQCQLSRLAKMAGCQPRRIGLSATLNDYDQAEQWLTSGDARGIEIIAPNGGRKLRLGVDHVWFPDPIDEKGAEELAQAREAYYNKIYELTHQKKAIIFTNSRTEAEITTTELRRTAQRRHESDVFYVHHGSLSAMLREEAETALKEERGPAVAAATLTLELGIDLGKLDRIVQLGAPYTCASFVQRLGRSGRRGNDASEMFFLCPEEETAQSQLPASLPWTLLRAIAVIELYIRDKWVESFTSRQLPWGILYHQTMSILKGLGEATPSQLAKEVLTLPAFKSIVPNDYRIFLNHLLGTNHLERLEDGKLIIGLAGEKVVNNFRFYAVFQDDETFTVYKGLEEIGSINRIPPVDSCFSLSGIIWKVIETDLERKNIFVVPAKGKGQTLWSGSGGGIDTRVMQKMRQTLLEDRLYSYLKPNAQERLIQARRFVSESGILDKPVVPIGENTFYVLPWVGSRAFRTVERLLKYELFFKLKLRSVISFEPYYLVVTGKTDEVVLLRSLLQSSSEDEERLTLLAADEIPLSGKYEEFVAPELISKAFRKEGLDLTGLLEGLTTLQ
ncbi:DEAD/DEAH box helicase [Paenibacillaceae bacterium]|nr:DEAD/DEAH box helicase [Paenibacillaceae bacterium]